jgi:ferritin-like metal-binding protein YciE
MADAANNARLKEAFTKHLAETEHVERLKKVFALVGENAQPKPCRAMIGLVEEGQEKIEEGRRGDVPVSSERWKRPLCSRTRLEKKRARTSC